MTHSKKCPICKGTGEISLPMGERIRDLREELSLSQDTFAKSIGVSRPALANIESGRQSIVATDLVVISRVHSISVDWLLGLTDVRTALSQENKP